MGVGNRKNLKRKKSLSPQEKSVERKRRKTSTHVFHGLVFQSSPKLDFLKTTTLKSRPNVIFNAGDIRNVLIDYSASITPEDREILNTFFTVLKDEESTFNIKTGTAEYVNELKTQKTTNLEISFTFLKFIDGNKILARANDPMEVIDEMYVGKYFIKTPQITIKESPNTKRKTSKILNYTQSPSFKELDIGVGDVMEFKGTRNNNISVTVLGDLVTRDEESGREEILVTSANDESLLGVPVTIDYYRKRNDVLRTNIETLEDREPITSAGSSNDIMSQDELRNMSRRNISSAFTSGRSNARDLPIRSDQSSAPVANPSSPTYTPPSSPPSGGGGGGSGY